MASIQIAVTNVSTVLTDADIQKALPSFQIQIHRDFAPVWGIDADLTLVPVGQVPASSWQLCILDDSDQAGALGYHDVTKAGLPLGKVFARTDLMYKAQWTVTASHELLEMLADPDINLNAQVLSEVTPDYQWLDFYAYEICDPCEADELGYDIDGILVSDFVYPSWFETFWKQDATQFDHQKTIHNPLELAPGGRLTRFDVSGGLGWREYSKEKTKPSYEARPRVGSRRERRRTPRDQWMRSTK